MALASLVAPAEMPPYGYARGPIFIAEIIAGLWLWVRGISLPAVVDDPA
jgi:hypothetical protein